MKPILVTVAGALAFCLVSACVPRPKQAPPIQARPAPAPVPAPAPAPPATNWMDAPASTGEWRYRDEGARSLALFGGVGAEAEFVMRCERANGTITLSRAGGGGAPVAMRVRTETAERVLTARTDAGASPQVYAALPASDRLFDAMALSKGRFAVEVAGAPSLYLPSWAEVTRVIEDCR